MDLLVFFIVVIIQSVIAIVLFMTAMWVHKVEANYSQFKNLQLDKISITKYNAAHDKFDNWLIARKKHFSWLGILFLIVFACFVYIDHRFMTGIKNHQFITIVKYSELIILLVIYLWVTFRIIHIQAKL